MVPALVLVTTWLFFSSLRKGWEFLPFLCALGLFLLCYVGLGLSMWPMMVPPHLTIWDVAAPASTQSFLLYGASVLIPLVLAYTAFVYWLFRGKVKAGHGYH